MCTYVKIQKKKKETFLTVLKKIMNFVVHFERNNASSITQAAVVVAAI